MVTCQERASHVSMKIISRRDDGAKQKISGTYRLGSNLYYHCVIIIRVSGFFPRCLDLSGIGSESDQIDSSLNETIAMKLQELLDER